MDLIRFWTRHVHYKWIYFNLWNILITVFIVQAKRRQDEYDHHHSSLLSRSTVTTTATTTTKSEHTLPASVSLSNEGTATLRTGTAPSSALHKDVVVSPASAAAAFTTTSPNKIHQPDPSRRRKVTPPASREKDTVTSSPLQPPSSQRPASPTARKKSRHRSDGGSTRFAEAKESARLALFTPRADDRFQGSSSAKQSRRIPERRWTSDEERLYNYLFRRYNRAIRPVRKATDAVEVALTFSLLQIHGLDEKSQVFRTYGWLIVEWTDERLSWSMDTFNNMTEFVVESTTIWTPEITLINAVEFQFPDFSNYRAIIGFDGRIRWEPAGVFETSCKIDITFYPYDIQECSLVFGTWSYTSFKLNMTNSTPNVILDDYNTSGEWHITKTNVTRNEFMYECCPNIRFSKVSATIYLVRRHRFYTMNLIMPCAMLSSLTLVTFLSPPDQGEKISLGISILLSFSVFMLQLSENMPKTSETLPLFGIYTTFVMMMNTWSVMLTVLVLNLHHRNEHKPVPRWVRAVVFEGLARVLCMYSKTHRQKRDYYKMVAITNVGNNAKNKNARSAKKNQMKDGYSISFASPKYSSSHCNTSRVANAGLFTSDSSGAVNAHAPSGTSGGHNTPSNITYTNASDEFNNKTNNDAENYANEQNGASSYELQEWKRVARIVDRLFFWLTLLALISVSVGMLCLLLT